jgi:pimeloyl-ACP methyl ester carboxylesterase
MSHSMKPMRAVRGISQSLCIVFLLFICGVLSAQNQEHRVRNIVLVHGAWADGSGWKGVYDILVKDGYNVSIVQEPETSFQDDVTAVKRILALQDGPSILVAHSYGGAVITEAGDDPSVLGLVYIAAHMPDAGEKESDDGKRFPSDLAKSGAIKKTSDVSHILTRHSFMNCSQLTFLATKPPSWRVRRCSTLRTISQRRLPRLPGEPNRAGCWWREAIEPSARTWNVGTPSGPRVTRSKSQAPATQSTSRILRKLQM